MKRLFYIIVLFCASLCVSSCVRSDAVRIHELENISFSMQGGPRVNAVLLVENASARNIRVSDINFKAYDMEGYEIAEITVDRHLDIPRRSVTSVMIPMKISLADPVSGMRLMRNPESIASKLLVTGSAKVKMGGITKRYKFRDVPLSTVISNFGTDSPADMPKIL